MTGQSVDRHDQLLPDVLQFCEQFLGQASPATHHELDAFLRTRGITGGPGWLIDMLGLSRLRLQHDQKTPAASPIPETTSNPATTIH
jgi:hypothetical protein